MSTPEKDPFTAAEAWLQRMLDPKTMNPFLRKKPDDSPYPSFNDRLSAMLIDGVWAFFLLGPIIQSIHPLIYGALADARPVHATDLGDLYRQMIRSGQMQKLMIENGITYALTSLIVVGMWSYASATPGKWLMRMRILRDGDYAKPTMSQWWLRYLGYLLFVPGFLWIVFDPKRRAWHDILARTVVVKVDHWRIRDDGSIPHSLASPSLPDAGRDGPDES